MAYNPKWDWFDRKLFYIMIYFVTVFIMTLLLLKYQYGLDIT